ncbi:MAG TPA: hypothetical protein VME40_13555 [Caulobacteraceae bacterium]|nr:hypothetical protein [Caulobacteraceae bacterium]
MKAIQTTLLAVFAGSGLAAVPAIAGADDFAGTWDIVGAIHADGPVVLNVTSVCVLQQTGAIIAGTCKGADALGPASGTAVGAKIGWTADVKATAPNGANGLFSFAGVLGADGVIRGEVKYAGLPGRVGTFTAHHP